MTRAGFIFLSAVFLLTVLLFPLPGCRTSGGSSEEAPNPLVGKWVSVRFSGPKVQKKLRRVVFEFRPDGTFTATTILRERGLMTKEVKSGLYTLKGDTIEIVVAGAPPQPIAKYRFENGDLIIEDINGASRGRYRRVPEKKVPQAVKTR